MSDRGTVVTLDILDAVLAALESSPEFSWPIVGWERPKDANERFIDPPYAIARIFPSTGQFDGPLTDSQIDTVTRFQIIGVGQTDRQALRVADLCRSKMKKSLIVIPGRYVQDVRFMVTTAGLSRDDDLPTPFFYASDIYEILTTPA